MANVACVNRCIISTIHTRKVARWYYYYYYYYYLLHPFNDLRDCSCSEVQSKLRSSKACLPTKDLFHNNSYARDDEGGNPGQVMEVRRCPL